MRKARETDASGSSGFRRLVLRPALALLAGTLALQVIYRFPSALIDGASALVVPSLEAFLIVSILAASALLKAGRRGAAAGGLALLSGFTFLFSLADALLELTFSRPLSLVTDAGYVPDLFRLLRDTLPRPVFLGGLVLLPAILAAALWGLFRFFTLLQRFFSALPAPFLAAPAGLVIAILCLEALAGVHVLGSSTLPRLAEEIRSALGHRAYETERRERIRAAELEEASVKTAALDLLAGRDVFLFIVESYGYTLYSEPEHFALAEPFLRRFEARLEKAGFSIVSDFLSSPAFGGNSWLADSTLATGVWIPDQVAYEALLESEVTPMAQRFNEAGYLTINSMPATTRDWPEGEYYGFAKKYYYRDFGYRGPSFRWAPLPDQYAIDVVHRREISSTDRPLFVQFVMISGHYPFSLLPRRLEDWSKLGDGSAFGLRENVRSIPIPPGSATAGLPGYVAAMEYQLDVATDYAARFLAGRKPLVIVVGDHQPFSGITGKGKPRSVPIHVFSTDPTMLEPFLARGYSPGWIPRQGLPHAGMETFLPGFLADFSSAGEAAVSR